MDERDELVKEITALRAEINLLRDMVNLLMDIVMENYEEEAEEYWDIDEFKKRKDRFFVGM